MYIVYCYFIIVIFKQMVGMHKTSMDYYYYFGFSIGVFLFLLYTYLFYNIYEIITKYLETVSLWSRRTIFHYHFISVSIFPVKVLLQFKSTKLKYQLNYIVFNISDFSLYILTLWWVLFVFSNNQCNSMDMCNSPYYL